MYTALRYSPLIILILLLLVFFYIRSRVGQEGAVNEAPTFNQVDTVDEDKGPSEGGDFSENAEPSEQFLVGVWISEDDEQSVLQFYEDSIVVSSYAGDAVIESGTYDYFSDSRYLPEDITPVGGGPFLRQTFNNNDYYYEISVLSDEELHLFYISGGGNLLRYAR